MFRIIVIALLALLSGHVSAEDFKVGQVWSYHTRDHEPNSRITILKIDQFDEHTIVAIRVDGLAIKFDRAANGVTDVLPHAPISTDALRGSVIELIETREDLPEFLEGYRIWREAFDAGQGGYFTIPVSDLVKYMEQVLNP